MSLAAFLQSRWPTLLSAFLLPTLWFVFAYAHWQAFVATQRTSLLVICLGEALISVLYLVRTEPRSVSPDVRDWLLAIGGTLLPLFLRPAPWGVLPAGDLAISAGAVLLVGSLLSLNRSLAIVAARRDLKTSGLYRVVRHPVYLSYVLMYSGYALTNTSAPNLLITSITLAILWARILREEAHLSLEADYREYMRRVRFRLIPFLL